MTKKVIMAMPQSLQNPHSQYQENRQLLKMPEQHQPLTQHKEGKKVQGDEKLASILSMINKINKMQQKYLDPPQEERCRAADVKPPPVKKHHTVKVDDDDDDDFVLPKKWKKLSCVDT